MAREHGPYSVAFPVDFTSRGDTTRDAFRKHMDEITRIYGILTGIDADTLDTQTVSDMLQRHIDSTNPHPNYTPSVSWSNVTNKPGLGDLSGSIDGSRISGTIAASKVSGALTGATIASGNVTGLEAFVKALIPDSGGNGDGITEKSLGETGYVKFANGLILQWGKVTLTLSDPITKDYRYKVSQMAKSFSSSSYCTACSSGGAYSAYAYPATSTDIRCGVSDDSGTVFYLAIGV